MATIITIELDDDGHEHITETIIPDGKRLCWFCHGDGVVLDDWDIYTEMECPECGGEGVIDAQNEVRS